MIRYSAVYHHAMGLFRSRARRKRENAAAKLTGQAVKLEEEQTGLGMAHGETTHRQVTAESRPNPDQPGWGQIAGQAIGKAREDRQRL